MILDIMYRSFRFQEASWDLFAVIIGSGVVVTAYQYQHAILGKSWARMALLAVVAALALAAVGAVLLLKR